MNREICHAQLGIFDLNISVQGRKEVLQLLDNSSCHISVELLRNLQIVFIAFLPKRTTSKLKLLDAGIIPRTKQRFRQRKVELAADLINEGVDYKLNEVDLKLAIAWNYDIWFRLLNDMILKDWGKTSLLERSQLNSSIVVEDDT